MRVLRTSACLALSLLSLTARADVLAPFSPSHAVAQEPPPIANPKTPDDVEKGLPAGDLPNLRRVNPNLLRGGRPTDAGLLWLKQAGIRTIVNLENDMGAVQHELMRTRQLGLNEISNPMRSLYAPSDAQVDSILAVLQDPKNYPIYLHCKHGEDRTGLMIGLYRVFADHWPAQAAYREMRGFGFHPLLWNLDWYFKRRASVAHK